MVSNNNNSSIKTNQSTNINNNILHKDSSITDSNQITKGSIKVIKFDGENEDFRGGTVNKCNPFNVSVKKQKVISFAPQNETDVNEVIEPQQDTSIVGFNLMKTVREKQKVISFSKEDENMKNKVQNSNEISAPIIDLYEMKFFNGLNGHLYVDLREGILELGNFYVSPIKIIIRDNGLYMDTVYRIKCTLENGAEETIIAISSYDLNDNKWIQHKLGIKYYIAAEKNSYALFKIYLSKQFINIKQEYQYDMIGWKKIKNKYLYLHGNGAIGSTDRLLNGSSYKRIEVDNLLNAHSALNSTLTLIDLSDNHQKTVPLFLYSHLSILTELFVSAGARPKFVLWIYGLTGSMKTSVSTIFFNLFNRVSKPEISATFKDTPSAIEIKAFEAKDSTLLVDDYHPTTSSNEKRSMDALASHILRMYGDGITKARANKNMQKQKEYPPRGLCVITGEDRLSGESTVARYLGIEVTAGTYKTDVLSFHQNNPLIVSTHMYYFLQWISNDFDNIKEFIRSKFTKYRNEGINFFRHKRLNECFTIFRIMSEILLSYCVSVGYFDNSTANSTLKYWNDIVLKAIKLHEESNTNQDPAIMYLIAIDELVSSNKCTLATIGQSYSEKQNIIGYKDDRYYYLIPETTFISVRNFWKGQGIEFPVSAEQINKALDNLKVIETSLEAGKTRRTVKCSPDGKNRRRFLKINLEMVNKLLNN